MKGYLRKLPNGDLTSSVSRYCREWRKMGNVIGNATGTKLIAFDPGFQFQDIRGSKTLDMPMWFALRLLEKLSGDEKAPIKSSVKKPVKAVPIKSLYK